MTAKRALTGAKLFDGERMLLDHALIVEGAKVVEVKPLAGLPDDLKREELKGGVLSPGFVDLQVNGGGGLMLNDDPSPGTVAAIARAHRAFGVTSFLPTLITDTEGKTARAIEAVALAMEHGAPAVAGLHLEGPFFNPARAGIHDPSLIREPFERDLDLLLEAAGKLKLKVTLAPEVPPKGFVKALSEAGVLVFAGHSEATFAQANAAADEGLRGFTHLFNAMSQLTPREPGLVGAALASPDLYCGIIADGRHVHPANLELAYRSIGSDRLFLISDAMAVAGTDANDFRLQGRLIKRERGRLVDQRGTLAGADLDMAAAVRGAIRYMGASTEDALKMATSTPAAAIKLERGRLKPDAAADLAWLDDKLHVRATWIAGERQDHAKKSEW